MRVKTVHGYGLLLRTVENVHIIEDWVTGEEYTADGVKYPTDDEISKFLVKLLDQAMRKSNEQNNLVGKLFRVNTGCDLMGSAFYEVTKETANRATVSWRGYSPDRCVDNYFRRGGNFKREKIVMLVQHTRQLYDVFGRLV